jgi:predicted transposase YbfD/YdcC
MLDMTFREDESLIRKGRGPLAFNMMRKIAMTFFKQDQTKCASIAAKKRWMGWTTSIAQPF